jgi:hypothetical protein
MTEQARACCSEPGGAWCATTTGASSCATEAMTEQARETPEPLTPAMTDYDRGYANGYQQGLAALRAVTPDPAELTDCEALCYVKCHPTGECEHHAAVTPDPAEHDRQAVQGTHLFDEFCPGCAATPDPAEPGLRKAVTAHVACVCEQLTGEGPRPLGNGRVYHFQGCCADSDLAAALSDTTEGQS